VDNQYWKYKNVDSNYEKKINVIPLLPEEGTKGWREKCSLKYLIQHHPVLRTPLLKEEGTI
jgi:hypothetical protein